MKIDEMEIIAMELKYCERCGALFLRPQESEDAYCPTCEVQMEELPPPSLRPSRVCLPTGPKAEIEGEDGGVLVVCSGGGHA